MDPCVQYAMMFLGTVIGAGFASGREVISFFSAYGNFSWGLILLSSGVMTGLCCLCLRRAASEGVCGWCAIYTKPRTRMAAECCILLLQALMGGSMLSAAGHIAALCLPWHCAYTVGVLVTIALALLLGSVNLRPLTLLSSLLAAAFVASVLAVLVFDKGERTVLPLEPTGFVPVGWGSLRAIAYGALNLAVSIGMVCRCGGCPERVTSRCSVLFGFALTGLLFVSNFLYLKHPELWDSTFPMVSLLARFGKLGYIISLLLMYLAILTTLSAGLYALRTGLEEKLPQTAAWAGTVLVPLVVSCAGFEAIVDSWYAPIGLCCLALVFVPLMRIERKIS